MGIESVGVIGLGTTGAAVARRLLQHGLGVTVHDRDVTKMQALVEAGARPAHIPADAAESAEVVFVHVPNVTATEDVLFDCGGVGETLREGGVVLLASRMDPASVRDAATRLAVFGLELVEAWLVCRADSHTTTAFVGCAVEDLRRVGPLFRPLTDQVVYTGPAGSVAALRTVLAAASAMCPTASDWQWDEVTVSFTGRDCIATLAAVAGEWLPWENDLPRYHDHPEAFPAEATTPARGRGGTHYGTPSSAVLRQASDSGPRSIGQHCSSESKDPCSDSIAVARSRVLEGIPGPLTEVELMKVVDAVCERSRKSRLVSSIIEVPESCEKNCLGLTSRQFNDVVAKLEQQFCLPLLDEALQCTTQAEFISIINTQVTSGV